MKIHIIFLAVLGLAVGKSLATVSLMHDVEDFMQFVPINQTLVIFMDYLHHDQEVKELVAYMQSPAFPMIHSFMEHMREYTEMKVPCFKFFNEHGFDVYEFVRHLHHLLHMPPYETTHRTDMGVGLHGLYEDMHSVLHLEKIWDHLHEKMESRDYLRMMVEYFNSDEFMSLVEKVKSWPEYHKMHEIVREKFVHMHHIHEVLKELYWRGMHMFEHEMMEFIPLDRIAKVLDILMNYMTHDPELKEFFVYIQSEEFPMIHKGVEHMKKYKEMHMPCMEYINEHGIDFYAIVHDLHSFMSKMHVMPPLEPTHMGVGLPGLIEDITRVLPFDKWNDLIEKKMQTDEHFKMLYTHFNCYEFMEMMRVMRDTSEYRKMVEFLQKIRMYHRTH